MWGAFRWTARFLLLVMLAPAYGPLAMAYAARPEAMHCMRQPVSAPAQPAMQCHHAMAQSKPPEPESSEPSFQATDNKCCLNHDCCGAATTEWAQPVANSLSVASPLIERALPSCNTELRSADISGHDSARAPPHS